VLTVIGPYTSLVLATAFGLVATAAGRVGLGEVAEVCGLLGWLNLVLMVFNLLPGAPLDGGRIVSSIVWRLTSDRDRADLVAARAGQGLGALVLTAGLFEVFFVLGAFASGLWLVMIGWFLMRAAVSEERGASLRRFLSGRRADTLVTDDPEVVGPDASLAGVVASRFRRHHVDAVAVNAGGRTVGVVRLGDVKNVAPERWFLTTARDVMRPVDDVPRVAAEDDATALVAAVTEAGLAAVTKGETVVTLVSARQLDDVLARLRTLQGARHGAQR
jgi:CBS domain-containing protein